LILEMTTIGRKGGASALAPHEDNEGLLVHDTFAQESHRHDEPKILQEELLSRGHRQKKTFILLRDYVIQSIN